MHPQSAGEAWNFEINFFVLRHQEGFYKNSQRINHLPPKIFNLTVKLPHWSLLKRNIGPEKCYIFIKWSLPKPVQISFSTHGQADLLKSARNFWRMNAQQMTPSTWRRFCRWIEQPVFLSNYTYFSAWNTYVFRNMASLWDKDAFAIHLC